MMEMKRGEASGVKLRPPGVVANTPGQRIPESGGGCQYKRRADADAFRGIGVLPQEMREWGLMQGT